MTIIQTYAQVFGIISMPIAFLAERKVSRRLSLKFLGYMI